MKSTLANWQRILYCLRIEPINGGAVLRMAQYPENVEMSNGQIYQSDAGYEFTGIEYGNDFSPASIDLESFLGESGITRSEIETGVYDNAKVYVFATDWAAPVEDEEPIIKGIFGKTTLTDDKYRVEIMSLIDALNETVGLTFTAECRHTFGSPECGIDLSSHEYSGTITSAVSGFEFQDTARGEGADFFVMGTVVFNTGANAGLKKQEIKSFAADGTIVVHESFASPPQVGDQYTIVAGCQKRFTEDCKTLYSNGPNFGGFPHMPTESDVSITGTGG